ncbi:hypothetical protein HY339_00335 [Candidatus Gottesmanbacteria bacterium]|nr:hypothetical protein [Candidatus Gottesmanbacteria bacterium]
MGKEEEENRDYWAAIPPEIRRLIAKKRRSPRTRFGKTIQVGGMRLIETDGRTDDKAAPYLLHNLQTLFGEGPWSEGEEEEET